MVEEVEEMEEVEEVVGVEEVVEEEGREEKGGGGGGSVQKVRLPGVLCTTFQTGLALSVVNWEAVNCWEEVPVVVFVGRLSGSILGVETVCCGDTVAPEAPEAPEAPVLMFVLFFFFLAGDLL